MFDIDLTYITSRGAWYNRSWKGDIEKSGGIATNIGVHFFDMLGWIFGEFQEAEMITDLPEKASGKLRFERANVNWMLSVDERDLPENIARAGKRTYRKIDIEGQELEFSEGFTDLHTDSYKHILAGNGFGISDARTSIEIVSKMRQKK